MRNKLEPQAQGNIQLFLRAERVQIGWYQTCPLFGYLGVHIPVVSRRSLMVASGEPIRCAFAPLHAFKCSDSFDIVAKILSRSRDIARFQTLEDTRLTGNGECDTCCVVGDDRVERWLVRSISRVQMAEEKLDVSPADVDCIGGDTPVRRISCKFA